MIFLTVCDDEVNTIMGLDLGADDYIAKPFRVRELIRGSTACAVTTAGRSSGGDRLGDIRINPAEAESTKRRDPLAHRPGAASAHPWPATRVSPHRNQILREIWDLAGDFVSDNTLTVYIKRLREKIEDNPGAAADPYRARPRLQGG